MPWRSCHSGCGAGKRLDPVCDFRSHESDEESFANTAILTAGKKVAPTVATMRHEVRYSNSDDFLIRSSRHPTNLTAPPPELIGSAQVAVRLPFLRFDQRGPRAGCCKYKSAHAHHPTLAFGPQHAIGHCVSASSKPMC
jgi:hypothetical protein